ncbi:MAG: hypothetical protein QG574_4966 [Cyanobacteriota bacterium erpe_2018_sw_21hr_WHONDRS-SW48-000092_B_bin.40]|jgi:DNA helicase HerA-like ATPase|nr:hypothetical protein [Cyanobacteriota bacterium erpe_2018_sw_21hr_WHONDRS-SW48-000092_B_bin.40]
MSATQTKAIFDFSDEIRLGTVKSVDTTSVLVSITSLSQLLKLQVNRLVALQSSRPTHTLIGVVQKINRSYGSAPSKLNEKPDEDFESLGETSFAGAGAEINLVKIVLIGTFIDKIGSKENIFRRTLETVPDIEAACFPIESDRLTAFMRVISEAGGGELQRLSIGHYTLDEHAEAFLSGNRLFQRHAVLVGSTGSGKSWTVARLLEQVASLPNANAILIDVHGEYAPLNGSGFQHFKIAGPSDLDAARSLKDGIIHLPFWLMGYEDSISMLVDRSDQNAPNQSMILAKKIAEAKRITLTKLGKTEVLTNFTSDSPIPFDIRQVIEGLEAEDVKMVPGAKAGTEKAGELNGKLTRLILRLKAKVSDRRLGFMFSGPEEAHSYEALENLAIALMAGTSQKASTGSGVKIIDFSEVPSDILPLIVSSLARLIFSIQQWTEKQKRHPIAIFCDEAHLYIPEGQTSELAGTASRSFERISKEGRKYGVALVVISQRPSEVNKTVLSQCGNFIAMRLTNAEDQNVIKRMMPDTLSGFTELLPILDVGEALIVGDASLLPSRVRISKPVCEPASLTVPFWDRWSEATIEPGLKKAVESLRRQSQSR